MSRIVTFFFFVRNDPETFIFGSGNAVVRDGLNAILYRNINHNLIPSYLKSFVPETETRLRF